MIAYVSGVWLYVVWLLIGIFGGICITNIYQDTKTENRKNKNGVDEILNEGEK